MALRLKLTTANPFQKPDDMSDAVLKVEDQPLHVHKTFLALHSPVLKSKLYPEPEPTPDFALSLGLGAGVSKAEVELPGKRYNDVLELLLQLYPNHDGRTMDDDRLRKVLPLAEEYKINHVRRKCQTYIKEQMEIDSSLRDGKDEVHYVQLAVPFDVDRLLLFLWLCDQSGFQKQRGTLLEAVERQESSAIAKSRYYELLDPRLMRDVMYRKTKK